MRIAGARVKLVVCLERMEVGREQDGRREAGGDGGSMPRTPDGFSKRLDEIKGEMVVQGRRVQALVEKAYEAAFARDVDAGVAIARLDEEIDRVDVEIERTTVQLLTEACSDGAALLPEQVRLAMTIVKINNELERIADVGVNIGQEVAALRAASEAGQTAGLGASASMPPAFRVLTNSVVGMVRDSVTALDKVHGETARVVLLSEEAVGEFKKALVADVQKQLVEGGGKGRMSQAQAAALHDIAMYSLVMADHCTNIAEQILYVATGRIMRHMKGHWEEVTLG
jgi:phosphate transport system protein